MVSRRANEYGMVFCTNLGELFRHLNCFTMRRARQAPAVGYYADHIEEQSKLILQALGLEPNPFKETTHD